jgi:hypothetical protein
MITKVELGSVSKNNPQIKGSTKGQNLGAPNFTGLGELALKGIQYCEQYPMVNVSVLDLSTAILPRTFFETFIGSKQKDENGKEKRKLNIFGGFEAFRREFSGLFINCLIPSFVVIGVAKLLNKPIMGDFNKSNLTRSWANSEVLNKVQKYFLSAKGDNKEEKILNTVKDLFADIEGVDGDISKGGLKKFKDIFAGKNEKEYNEALENFAKDILQDKPSKKYTKDLYKFLVGQTGIAENIRFAGDEKFSTSSLSHICDSLGDVLHGIAKEGITNDADKVGAYFKKATKLVNAKSAIGLLGVIIPLAISAQPINRWITHKLSGKKGAPIYNDDQENHLTKKEKSKLNKEKLFAVPLMWAVAGLSMLMDRPSLGMFQFKGLFPTMDQARLISAATFSSRIAASEDSNELKESTIRDIATFSSFYFLGDYAAKAIATVLEKYTGIKLINRLKEKNPNASIAQKFWDWAKHTTMKSTDELKAITDTSKRLKAKNLRATCQLGNLAFSLLSLGIFIPLYTRTQTNKKRQQQMEREAQARTSSASFTSLAPISPAFRSFSLVQNKNKEVK